MKSIVVWTRKGGVGKTTLATHLAWHCARAKSRVVVIDLDPQGNASDALAEATQLGEAASLFREDESITLEASSAFSLFSGTDALIDIERQPIELVATTFQKSYSQLAAQFDLAIIDGPAGQTLTLVASLLQADFGVSPLDLGQWSVSGVEATLRTFFGIRERYNRRLVLLGLVPFRVDNRLASNRATLQGITQAYGRFLLPAKVSMRSAIGQVAIHRRPVWDEGTARDAGLELKAVCELLTLRMQADAT